MPSVEVTARGAHASFQEPSFPKTPTFVSDTTNKNACKPKDTSYTSVEMQNRFEFIAGSDALCFVDTLGGRAGNTVERLQTPEDLLIWFAAAGLAASGRHATQTDLLTARKLREAVHRCGMATIQGNPLPPPDIDLINQMASSPPLRPQLVDGALQLHAEHPVMAALSTLAADALMLLGPDNRDRIRLCPGCRMMFVDTSRPGRRQWCSSASGCGNRAKLKARRARQVGSQKGDGKDD